MPGATRKWDGIEELTQEWAAIIQNRASRSYNARPEYHYTFPLPVSQNRYSGGIVALSHYTCVCHYTSTIPIINNRDTGGIVGSIGRWRAWPASLETEQALMP
jgi:hypothetical protein